LYEALGGVVPLPPGGPIRLAPTSPDVSPGVQAIVRKCLAPAARDRYPDAAALAADLRRHLADLPLRGVANRSPAERWRKWRRRRPYALPLLGLLLASVLAAGFGAVHVSRQARAAEAARRQGEDHLRQHRYAE